MACVVCELGEACGPMQRTDCCGKPFHWNRSCASALGIRARRGGPTGDLRCAPHCMPCVPEGAGDDWQLRLLIDKIMTEQACRARRITLRCARRRNSVDRLFITAWLLRPGTSCAGPLD